MTLFDRKDFRVFDIIGFGDRMHAIRERIQPRLAEMGEEFVPLISALADQQVYAHVARHARRTVNPPDDTWVAFGPDKRGYKKDVHFKIAISRGSVRLLFEVGPEYYDKAGWIREWKREFETLLPTIRSGSGLGWYHDEHDEEPSLLLRQLDHAGVSDLGRRLTDRRDGQFVMGRRLDEARVSKMGERVFRRAVGDAFRPLRELFTLHEQRVRA